MSDSLGVVQWTFTVQTQMDVSSATVLDCEPVGSENPATRDMIPGTVDGVPVWWGYLSQVVFKDSQLPPLPPGYYLIPRKEDQ